MKSVRISDETYTKIVRDAKKNRRTISGTIELLIEYGMQVVNTANINMNMAMGIDIGTEPDPGYDTDCADKKPYTVEEWSEYYRKRKEKMGWKPKKAAPDMSEEELIAMNKKFKEDKAN